jgi:hypothetical protein
MRKETFTLRQKELQRVSVIANRGWPSHRRLPESTRQAVVQLARSKYVGFNDHHLCEKLTEVEGLSLSRETLRRLRRKGGLSSPRRKNQRFSFAGAKVRLYQALDGRVSLYSGDTCLERTNYPRG